MNPHDLSRDTLRTRLRDEVLPTPPAAPPPTDGDPELADLLRAAAALGRAFGAEEMAQMVGRTPLQVLLTLQRGVDRGLRIEEDGRRFRIPVIPTHPPLAALRAEWDRILGTTAPEATVEMPASRPPAEGLDDVTRLVGAAREAFRAGQPRAALTRGASALAMLEGREEGDARLVRAGLLSDCAVYLSRLSDPLGPPRALRLAQSAVSELQPSDPPDLQASARIALAGIATEEGSEPALDLAIDALTEAARLLQGSGQAIDAARLLNDLAEVWMRRGDPVRAAHLLKSSRSAFEKQARTDPKAAFELACTEHLLARLAMHASARPGAEKSVWVEARTHALAALAGFQKLGQGRHEGRTLETLGRILLRLGDLQDAAQALQAALAIQRRLEDLPGLARTSNALAQVLAHMGGVANALRLLEESVELDLHLGSLAGLRFNAADVERLAPLFEDAAHQPRLAALRARLRSAMEMVSGSQPA